MEIILQKDVDELGFEGEIVKVARGYARNYLIPKGLALKVSAQNISALDQRKKKIEVRRLKAKEEAENLKSRLESLRLAFRQKAGEEGKLYGSVTSMDIAGGLEKQGIVIDRRKILLEKPIKTLGEFDVPVRVYPGVTGTVKVEVLAEEGKSE